MDQQAIFEAFKAYALDILDVDEQLITADAHLNDTLEADSVDVIEIAARIERQFDVELEDRELYDIETVQDFVDLVIAKAQA